MERGQAFHPAPGTGNEDRRFILRLADRASSSPCSSTPKCSLNLAVRLADRADSMTLSHDGRILTLVRVIGHYARS